ncbi:uncharacterized protein ARB_07093 [Trichophyton benhamiae CBS 112371]|uniref:Uncharacterized protein n=1 Tax=Arthroderma benhamiae (strain ATCC MYA-4681 / CBS 112371) TaxID=663331 RepID=D4AS78_ARTBC|nr:uncharacterized protein ARB_07093 [Trichophyton benhamiae CBS 112371]EFE34142.1 hypothetical protein ARB_07093 [Trichophyton benhamiae CBS 112371]
MVAILERIAVYSARRGRYTAVVSGPDGGLADIWLFFRPQTTRYEDQPLKLVNYQPGGEEGRRGGSKKEEEKREKKTPKRDGGLYKNDAQAKMIEGKGLLT